MQKRKDVMNLVPTELGVKLWLVSILTVVLLLAGCNSTAAPETAAPPDVPLATTLAATPSTAGAASPEAAAMAGELVVFTAASLTEVFTELGQQFEAAHPGTTVTFNFAGSQQLAQQLAQGAPADAFASANKTQLDAAIAAGRVAGGSERPFVRNRLVVVYPADNPAELSILQDLAKPGLQLVLAADAVPVGEYSLAFLDKASQDPAFGASFQDDVLANVVSYEENVRAVLNKVELGEADAGIVYTSDITQDSADQVGQIEIPDALNVIATYPIAPTTDSGQPALAEAFIALVLSPEGQAVLARYGFIPSNGP